MNTTFFRYWLPLSVGAHLLVLAVLQCLPPSITTARGESLQQVTVVSLADTPKVLIPDRQPEALPPLPRHTPQKAARLGVAHPQSENGISASDVRDEQPGAGAKPTAPPKIMTANNGSWATSPGQDDGIGTLGTEHGASGPSSGAAAKGGPDPVYPKLALERGAEGTVVVRVNISAGGSIAPVVLSSSGDADLDAASVRTAKRWSFSPAMNHGQPAAGTVNIRFHFAGGAVNSAVEGN